jgi:hypothetical protein
VAFYRRGLLAGLDAILDERVDGLRIRRQIRLALRLTKCLKDRSIGLLRTQVLAEYAPFAIACRSSKAANGPLCRGCGAIGSGLNSEVF